MSKEINLAHDLSAEIGKTAVIRVAYQDEREGRSVWNPRPPFNTLMLSITDLSKPNGENGFIELDSFFGSHPRVSPGQYMITVSCVMSGVINFKQAFEIQVDAKAGKTYLLECLGDISEGARVTLREVEQQKLQSKT